MTNKNKGEVSELSKHLATLSEKELITAERTTALVSMIVNITGICVLLFALMFPVTGVILASFILVYLLAHFGIGVTFGLIMIRQQLGKIAKADK